MFGDCAAVTVGRDFDFDVVVVGFGPVGAVAACLLGQQGRRVLVLDRERDIFPLPRAIVLDDEAMRLFRSLGLSDQIEPFTTPIRTVQFADPADWSATTCRATCPSLTVSSRTTSSTSRAWT
jgi:2-polyprenyl-6-methoxyphenol hydroxylase-like FAD-dependent oxidoreductase